MRISAVTAKRLFAVGIAAQMGIVVTGGLVRLTGSGLGCPDWPDCVGGSLTPLVNQPQGYHKGIEFGNRLLSFVVVLVVLACILAAWQLVPRRRPLVMLASAGLLGVLGQAVLGGLTVLTGLNPFLVAAHFLLSMVLITFAVALYERHQAPSQPEGPPRPVVRDEVRWLVRALVIVAVLVLVAGTMVTGSGPHSGDAKHPARTGFNVAEVAWLHADLVTAFCGLLVALLIALRLSHAPPLLGRRARVVVYVTVAQAGLGYVQYFTGVPWVLVAVHVLGATAFWVSVLRVAFALGTRSQLGRATDERVTDEAVATAGRPPPARTAR